ncbi:hypothetical protein [Bradyrhizobium diazoefficiens]
MTVVYKHPEGRGAVLTASGEHMWRADAEALGYTVAPYVDLVAPSARFATRHPEYSDLAILPPFGLTVTNQTARAMGFALSALPLASAKPSRADPKAAWRSAIMKLAEANERSSATAELLTSQTPETLSVEAARAFLRGLPVETEQTETEEIMTTNNDPARAARLAEISVSVASFNRDRGWREPQRVATKAATAAPNVEPEKLKRLAEIRFNALQMNSQGHTQEAKKLKCALDAHATTGAPLSRLLAQLEVDTSKFVRNV